jgi:hypothetical protein
MQASLMPLTASSAQQFEALAQAQADAANRATPQAFPTAGPHGECSWRQLLMVACATRAASGSTTGPGTRSAGGFALGRASDLRPADHRGQPGG